jgi:hypothetical protein
MIVSNIASESVLPLNKETFRLLGILFGGDGGHHLLFILFALSFFRDISFNLQKFFGCWISIFALSKD